MKKYVLASLALAFAFLSAQAEDIRTEVTRVQVPVTLMDSRGRLIGGDYCGRFHVFEDKEEQEILSCSEEDVPVSIVIVFDNSGSMLNKVNLSRAALKRFVDAANGEDEYSLIVFNDVAQLETPWIDGQHVLESLLVAGGKPDGRTALLDALYLGVSQVKTGRHPRHAIFLITDGGDNHSRYNENNIKQVMKESDVQFYAIGLFNANPLSNTVDLRSFPTHEELMGPQLLYDLTFQNGGLSYALAPNAQGIVDGQLMNNLAEFISRAIRMQYVLTFKPRQSHAHDGKYHKLKVRIDSPRGMYLIPYTREGYRSVAR
jgi:Ca-activated chloride channel family protein